MQLREQLDQSCAIGRAQRRHEMIEKTNVIRRSSLDQLAAGLGEAYAENALVGAIQRSLYQALIFEPAQVRADGVLAHALAATQMSRRRARCARAFFFGQQPQQQSPAGRGKARRRQLLFGERIVLVGDNPDQSHEQDAGRIHLFSQTSHGRFYRLSVTAQLDLYRQDSCHNTCRLYGQAKYRHTSNYTTANYLRQVLFMGQGHPLACCEQRVYDTTLR